MTNFFVPKARRRAGRVVNLKVPITVETPVDAVQARVRVLDIQVADWGKEIEGETDPLKESLLQRVKELAEARADALRLELGGQAKCDATTEAVDLTIKKSDWTSLEKFKKWARENLLAISGVTIMAATLITSIIAPVRAAAKVGAKGASALGKSVAAIGKKLGPIFLLMGTAISLAAKGVSWFAGNLWLLALLVVYALYVEVSKRVKN